MKNILCSIFLMFLCLRIQAQKGGLYGDDIHIFEKTKVWELAKAVKHQNIDKIKELCKAHKNWINFQEWRFGMTVLNWAVQMRKIESVKALIEAGADSNVQDSSGTSPFIEAARVEESTDYLKLLLAHGGNVNDIALKTMAGTCRTPLIAAAGHSLENVKILVNAGANINYHSQDCESALQEAYLLHQINILKFLIIEKGANFKLAVCYRTNGDSAYISDYLRQFRFDLGSKDFWTKMEIVEYMKERGLDYWSAPIGSQYYEVMDEEKKYLETHHR